MAKKIRNVNLLLDDINKHATKIGLRALEANKNPLVIVGRDDDVSIVVERLLASNVQESLPVISIVGMRGQGKTTLARLVYNDKRVVSHFDKRIWVTMSDDFEVIRLLNEMLKSLTGTTSRVSDMEAISQTLESKLGRKKYLLVLDDVSPQNLEKWKFMRNSLLGIGGSRGSRVLVTTHSEVVVSTMETTLTRRLVGLSEEYGWDLFKRRAFAEGGAIETDNLVIIGKEMVQRCGGIPLAINVLGDLMHSKKSEEEWLLIKNSKLWNSMENIGDVLHTLKLVYYGHLESSCWLLCFAYCSMFPEHYVINKDKLIPSWMALGFLCPSKENDSLMVDIGNCFVDILLSNSLLEEVRNYGGDRCFFYKMLEHDELAQSASNSCSLTSEFHVNDASEVFNLSLCSSHDEALNIVNTQFRRLQTLLLNGGPVSIMPTNFKCLRVLVLESRVIKELPGSIGKLKHLRYFDIGETFISTLPSSITKLYNLQTIKLCGYIKELPKNFGNLINLRHLLIMYGGSASKFDVKQDKGWHLKELGRLNNLTGALRISGLEEVGSLREAKMANLSRKANIHTLTLLWRDTEENESHFEEAYNNQYVLEGLKPHSNLKELEIENFEGANFPLWMTEERPSRIVLHNLVRIRIEKCRGCSQIPALGHLPCLKVVQIIRMSKVRTIGSELCGTHSIGGSEVALFPSLRELTVQNMRRLKEWSEAVHPSRDTLFPSLEVLNIRLCERLRMVPSHFPFVKELYASKINSAALKEMSGKLTSLTSLILFRVEGPEFQDVIKGFLGNNRSLRKLWIDFCDGFSYFPDNLEAPLSDLSIEGCSNLSCLANNLVALETLSLSFCNNLTDIPCLQSVRKVSISHCEKLIGLPSLTQVFPVVEKLTMTDLANMMAFPNMHRHTSLRKLYIGRWEKLTSVPELCMSLRSLQIDSCTRLTSLPELGTTLEELSIFDCVAMVSFPDFRYLRKLQLFENSEGHDYFPWPSSNSITSDVAVEENDDDVVQCLQNVELRGWPEIKSLPEQLQHLSALTYLSLRSFDGLDALPEWLGNLSSLQSLYIGSCRNLEYMPSVEAMRRLTNLRKLNICGCPLLEERCTEGSRPEWNKISHISEISIN
ncbi:hypothetical protein LguiB_012615 [Lonicera macranthoides]